MADIAAHEEAFRWPEGRRAALSLSFDDARPSQLDRGVPLLDARGVKATFYVSLGPMERWLDEWRGVAESGHEIGNHTVLHPCSGNFAFSRANPLESYTLERMEREMLEASERIESALGVRPRTFAYPCGQTFVGRGARVESYVPVVARHFLSGRTACDVTHNHPLQCDLAQLAGVLSDEAALDGIMRYIEATVADSGWLVLFGHEIGDAGRERTECSLLESVCRYAADPANGLWLDTVAAVGEYVSKARGGPATGRAVGQP
jgi:hypothetical protein